MTATRPAPDPRHRDALHQLQRKMSALEALTRASRHLKDAHAGITSFNPSVELLAKAGADIEVALQEARRMASPDGRARGEVAA